MADEQTEVRINFNVPLSTRKRWQAANIPFGVQAKVMSMMYELTVQLVEKHGLVALGALLDGHCELRLRREREQRTDQPSR